MRQLTEQLLCEAVKAEKKQTAKSSVETVA